MGIVIQALSAALIDDYFDFFDHRAFSDGSPFYPCYCNAFNMSAEQIRNELFPLAESYGGGVSGWREALRINAYQMVKSGAIRGYLAFDEGVSIGWCNANDRKNYYRVGEFDLGNVPDDVPAAEVSHEGIIKSIVCFEIAPDYRGQGIATKLLERVCIDAAEEGYSYVEAYPQEYPESVTLAFTGPIRMYVKAGFTEYKRNRTHIVMRKTLK